MRYLARLLKRYARNYSRALTLFEQQANDAKHDAQYNMAVLLQL